MKKSNLLYIFINISLLIAIIALNYFTDPYFIFNKARPLHISRYLLDEPYIPLKLHKNKKYDYVIVGGSTVNVLKLGNFNKKLADISCFRIKTQDMEKLLLKYLDMHPETKTVFLAIDFRQLSDTSNHSIEQSSEMNITSKDIFRLFLSAKTIQYSVKKILKRIPDYTVRLVKYDVHNIDKPKEDIEKLLIQSYGRMFEELNKRNIKVVYFIPPVHANRMIYVNEKMGYETILNIKKYLISQSGYIIDMSTLNKYTSMPLEDSFYLFSDVLHASDIYGYYIYNILFNTPNKDKDLFTVLTKDNIEQESLKQKKSIEKWQRENLKSYEYYIGGKKPNNPEKNRKTINDVPAEFRTILNYKKSIFYKN